MPGETANEEGIQKPPVFSVIVPTRGRPQYLAGCLAALRRSESQHPDFEVVVVNDGGTTEVDRVVARFAGELPVRLTTPKTTGPAAARNAGAAVATGKYLAFTDDDCEPATGWLAALKRTLDAMPGAAVGGVIRNGATNNAAAVGTQSVVDAVHAHFNAHGASPRFFASSNLAMPAECFRAIGGFDERFRYAEDREICERWIRSGHPMAKAPDAVVYHMRTLTRREFLAQHHGYGRGAWAFRTTCASSSAAADRRGVQRALIREALRSTNGARGVQRATYVALSQAATAAGYLREAVAARLGRRVG